MKFDISDTCKLSHCIQYVCDIGEYGNNSGKQWNTLRERGDSSSAKDNVEKILIGDIFVWKKREDTLINH